MKTICSIDSSTTKTGMALYVDGVLKEHLLIDYKNERDVDKRISKMCYSIYSQLKKWNPNIVIVEDDYNKNNVKTVKMLSNIIGAIRGYCVINDWECACIMPSQWRKEFPEFKPKMKREELKYTSIQLVKKNTDIDCSEDECDAINIGEAYLRILKRYCDDKQKNGL